MPIKTTVKTIFNCSLERAFKSPMLCDVTKVHTGYMFMPKVTHCKDDEEWGKPGGSRRVFMEKNAFFKGGEAALDTVLEREENKYWKIELTNFTYFSMGFYKFQGEWETREISSDETEVIYTYTLFPSVPYFYPFQWLMVKLMWRTYMKHVIDNVKKLAYEKAPYLHD